MSIPMVISAWEISWDQVVTVKSKGLLGKNFPSPVTLVALAGMMLAVIWVVFQAPTQCILQLLMAAIPR